MGCFKNKYCNLYEVNKKNKIYLKFQGKGLLQDKDSGVVRRGHSFFVSIYFKLGKKVNTSPRFTKSNY